MSRMFQGYKIPARNEKAETLGRKIMELVVSSNVTYQEAHAALERAWDILEEETRPVNIPQKVRKG